jgi:transposase
VASEPFIPAGPPQIRSGARPPADIREIEVADLPTTKHVPFKRLKMRHRRVIACHLQGVSNKDIAVSLGCSVGYVSMVLNNPTVAPILQQCYKDYEREFQALTPLCIAALRDNLEGEDPTHQLKAVDLTFKRQGTYEKKVDTAATAEDVIERILEITGNDGTRLRFSERRFLKAGDQQPEGDPALEDGAEIIDI